jgi:hypothetical protein
MKHPVMATNNNSKLSLFTDWANAGSAMKPVTQDRAYDNVLLGPGCRTPYREVIQYCRMIIGVESS